MQTHTKRHHYLNLLGHIHTRTLVASRSLHAGEDIFIKQKHFSYYRDELELARKLPVLLYWKEDTFGSEDFGWLNGPVKEYLLEAVKSDAYPHVTEFLTRIINCIPEDLLKMINPTVLKLRHAQSGEENASPNP